MNKNSGLKEEHINKAIWAVVALIVVSLISAGGYFLYTRYVVRDIPPLIQKQIDEAKREVEKEPQDADARVKLATLYISVDMFDEAKEELEVALKINKEHVAALTLLGTVYEDLGQEGKAESYYKRAISIAEDTEYKALNLYLYEAYYRLGSIYLSQKKYDEAIELFKKDSKLNPLDSDLHVQLGRAYLLKGDADAAILELEDALKYVPDYVEAHFYLGQAYEKKGEKDKAISQYEKALEYEPDYSEAKEALDKIK